MFYIKNTQCKGHWFGILCAQDFLSETKPMSMEEKRKDYFENKRPKVTLLQTMTIVAIIGVILIVAHYSVT